jgi:hypothetical protein
MLFTPMPTFLDGSPHITSQQRVFHTHSFLEFVTKGDAKSKRQEYKLSQNNC